MSTNTSWDQEEERMYNELRDMLDEVEGQEQRKKRLNRMIKHLMGSRRGTDVQRAEGYAG
ncbi:hypothetical protein [Paenibacillus sp. DCT19]|uniref:hypothetical protein n=1 Tax=Paenibacillus sp. DCT19 TaxID=2211212 RepID=UPI000FE1DA3A|nr:hypothetical protein [Paenibacillus sp. DCT19]